MVVVCSTPRIFLRDSSRVVVKTPKARFLLSVTSLGPSLLDLLLTGDEKFL